MAESEREEHPAETAEEERLSLFETLKLLGKASRGYWGVNIVNFSDGITYFGVLALLTLYLDQDIGMGTGWATFAVSMFTGVVTIGMFLGGGFISDWLGVRRALTAVLILLTVGRLLLFLAPGCGPSALVIVVVSISLLIMGFGEAIIQPALYSGVKEYADSRTQTMGYALIYSIMNLGIATEYFFSPFIRGVSRQIEGTTDDPTGGIIGVYIILCGITLITLFVHLLVFTKKVEETQKVKPSESAEATEKKSWKERLKELPILDKRFLFFIFVLLPVRTLFAHQYLTIPHYIARCFPHWVTERFELVNIINPVIIVICVPLITMFTRKVNIITMMIIGTSISALSTALLLPEPNLWLLLIYMIIWSLGEAAWSSRFLEYVAQLAPPGRVGAYMGIATVPWFLAKLTTGWYAGSVLDIFVPAQGAQAPGTMWLFYGAISVISPIGLIIGKRWVERGVQNPQS